jgi:transposase
MGEKTSGKVKSHEHYPNQCNRKEAQGTYAALSEDGQAWVRMPNPTVRGIQLHPISTGYRLSVERMAQRTRPARRDKKEISWQAVYYHFHKSMKRLGLAIAGAFFSADSACDTRDARKVCLNFGVIPNIAENRRNRKAPRRGRKRLVNAKVYKWRFTNERSFAWIDRFRALLIHFDRKDDHFLGAHHIAFAMINLRHVFALKV